MVRYICILTALTGLTLNGTVLAQESEKSCRMPLESLTASEKTIVTGTMGTANAIIGTPFQHWKNALQLKLPRPPLKELWRGTGVNIIRSTPSTLPEVLIMGNANEIIKKMQLPISCDSQKAGLAFAAAAPGTIVNTLAEQIVMRKTQTNSCYSITKSIIQTHGPTALFRGFSPKFMRDGTGACAYWYCAPKLKELYKNKGLIDPLATIAAGLSVALPSSIITHPFDTSSTQMANDISKKTYRHTFQTMRDYARLHGIKGLFKGLLPRIISAMLRIPALSLIQDQVITAFNMHKKSGTS